MSKNYQGAKKVIFIDCRLQTSYGLACACPKAISTSSPIKCNSLNWIPKKLQSFARQASKGYNLLA